ncbi:MAG: NTP transferase domain-containing protein [Ardenticatenaceae bacterium]|nr:NTP transferase domain-containing protein [Anaerolineales bacterium]MCB8920767.1 NTP transferase domain-containing protein [Ardenticatenaceae bacterium]MCB8989726.1 NTP transferase domain-containing protein [Ardenticatenaceae bacterium]MCB9002815.1 NTP transferase domain-containing protein [Ardenticatenaceae bacterium]
MTLAIVLLAAGQGTRMLSKKQKILHEVGGKPMVTHVFDTAVSISDIPPVLVVGPGETGVQALFAERARYVVQPEQLGTGHATMMAQEMLQGQTTQVLVTYGDMPLLKAETLARLAQIQAETGAAIAMLSVWGDPASSFGRVVRDENGRIREIMEAAQAKRHPDAAKLLAIREQNAGVYCFDAAWLWANIHNLPLRQARSGHEYYLTDMIELAVQQGLAVEGIITEDADECLGAGTRAELVEVEKAFRRRANARWLAQGVTLVDPDTTYIDPDVTIGQDTIIWPNSYLQGQTAVGEDCIIGPNAIVRDAQIGDGCTIEQTVVNGAVVEAYSVISNQ